MATWPLVVSVVSMMRAMRRLRSRWARNDVTSTTATKASSTSSVRPGASLPKRTAMATIGPSSPIADPASTSVPNCVASSPLSWRIGSRIPNAVVVTARPTRNPDWASSRPSTLATNAPRASAATNVMPHPVRARRSGPPRMRCRSISSPARNISVHRPSEDRKLMMSSTSAQPRTGPMRMPARISRITAGSRITGLMTSASIGANATAARITTNDDNVVSVTGLPPSARRDHRAGPTGATQPAAIRSP
jgi:hypothetical protein